MKANHFVVTLCLCLCLQAVSYAYLESGYTWEVYASYTAASGDYPSSTRGMVFDADGNLYLTNSVTSSVTKISASKQVTQNWATSLSNPCGITYTSGISYGDGLYTSCINSGKVVKIDASGNKTTFSSVTSVSSVAYDNTGLYGSQLYVGSSSNGGIYSVSTSGTTSLFCSAFYGLGSSGVQGLAVTSSGMYAATWISTTPSKSGVFKINEDGSATRVCTNLVSALAVYLDESGLFGGDLFAIGKTSWSENWQLYRISSDGIATLFFGAGNPPHAFTFGPDGALYAYYMSSTSSTNYDTSYVLRITPEPATLALLGAGILALRRRK